MMRFLSILGICARLALSFTSPKGVPTAITSRDPPTEVVNRQWAGMVVKQPAGQGFTSVEGTFQVPAALTFSESAPSGYNVVSIFLGLGDNDTTPQVQAAISIMSQKKGDSVTTSHYAWYTLSSTSVQEQLAPTQFSFSMTDTIYLRINAHTLSFENLSTGSSYSRNLTRTGFECKKRPCVAPKNKVRDGAMGKGETAYWILQEGVSTGQEFGDFGVLEWRGASAMRNGVKVGAGSGDRWVTVDGEGGGRVVQTAVIDGEYFQVGRLDGV
ncbi:hypothetical protein HYALB_00003960 [Hymenoscyphus albidus]|uniref:Concanavalin A-like lectin/glucanase n=1 Tax=Hymenoscyphus albidus TaxID=595503 RepID=A0A9N9LXI7_9HELO|nr:hypothetical protein HYALB_00003960 [Hymenoscyphus albidus]